MISGKQKIVKQINQLAETVTPFLFLIDFDGENGYVVPLSELAGCGIACCIAGAEMGMEVVAGDNSISMDIKPVDFTVYAEKFNRVQHHLKHGDTYLLNLTFPTLVGGDLDLKMIYNRANAPYKVMLNDKFLFYSPETFIRIEHNKISSFPMKGTIDATLEDARNMLINNQKELFEHYTIVDLIRNDLSIVAQDVEVEKFRYIDEITTASAGRILQSSSKITGRLQSDWRNRLGDIIIKLLPAGSICGAPKAMTVDIIRQNEIDERGFYTGVMGVFDGETVDSCVIIRYIEKREDGLFYYRSGGGITSRSDAREEYDELISKIYVPIV